MGLHLVLALLAFLAAIIGGVMSRGSVGTVLVAVAVVCLALIHLIGGSLG